MKMSAPVHYFYGHDDGEKGDEDVNDEDDECGASGCNLRLSHLAMVAFDASLSNGSPNIMLHHPITSMIVFNVIRRLHMMTN